MTVQVRATGHTIVAWDEARTRARAAARPLAPRRLALPDTHGAQLAEPLRARCALPATDQSAMDGYAVSGTGPWTVIGHARFGDPSDRVLTQGQACTIVTGAPLPAGTDAVLADEDAVREGDRVSGQVPAGRHIRRAGEQCVAGEVLLPAGALVRPAVVGLAAAAGHDTLLVHPHPRVLGLVTGDELVETGVPGVGQVRDAIGPMLPGLVAEAGGVVTGIARVPDTPGRLLAALATADADVVLVSGSSATGPADHLRPVLAQLGAELLVAGVACRPGHPQALARTVDGRLVVGLPGNPLAALAAYLTLAGPVLAGLGGEPTHELPVMRARGIEGRPSVTRLVPVRIGDGVAEPVGHTGSAMLRGVASADALAIVDPGSEAREVRVLALGSA